MRKHRIAISDYYYASRDQENAVACADAISIHVPLMNSTRGMVGAEVLAAAKDGVVIVSTARGGIIDDEALLAALDSGKVGFAGLDVISGEDFAASPICTIRRCA